MRELEGRLVVVTGGARGIGRATAARFLRAGARVVVADLDAAAAEEAARALASGGPVTAAAADVSSLEALGALVERTERAQGPIDVMVNNAGIMSLGPFVDHDPALERRVLEVNLFGVLNGMRAVLPGMLARRRGHIVNVASIAGRVGVPRAAAYAASKFAVVGASDSVRRELRGSGVELTCVLPYLTRTELSAGARALPWPPEVTAEAVAEALVEGVRRGAAEVYVPGITRLAAVLPAMLPRRVVAWLDTWLGVDALFRQVDPVARAPYLERLREGGPADPAADAPPPPPR